MFTITGGSNLGMYEVSEAAKVITQSADPNAKVIFGAIIDEGMKDEIKVTVIATGFEQRPAPSKVKSVVAGGTYTSSRTPEPLDRMSFTGRSAPTTSAPAPRSSAEGPFTAAAIQPDEPIVSPPPRMPDPAPAAHQPHVQSPTYAPTQPPRPPAPPSRVPGKTSEEEDLEIPAFLRKKMM